MSLNFSYFSRHENSSKKCFFVDATIFDKEDCGLYLTSLLTVIINGFMATLATIGNTLFIVALLKTKPLQTPSNILLGNLAVSDLLVGLTVQPLYITYKSGELSERYSCPVHVSFITIAWITVGVSFLTLTTISLERYISICKSFLYPSIVQEKRVFAVSGFIWIFTMTFVISRFCGLGKFQFYIFSSVVILISFITTITIYVRIYRISRRHQKLISDQTQIATKNKKKFLRETKLTKTVGLITGIFFLSYLPVLGVMGYSLTGYNTLVKTIYSWTDTIVFSNSSLNPLVYYLRNQQIRTSVLKLLGSPKLSQNVQNQVVAVYSKNSKAVTKVQEPDTKK